MKVIELQIQELSGEVDLHAIRFRKRGVLGRLKNIDDNLMKSLRKNEDLLKEKDSHYEAEELEEKLKQSAAFNKINIELMTRKKELELKLEEVDKAEKEILEARITGKFQIFQISGGSLFHNNAKEGVVH